MLHTSRVGTGSSKLLSTLTDRFIAEANSWEAATSSSPALSSKKDDNAERRGPVGCKCASLVFINRGDVSSGIGGPSPLAGKSELHEENVVAVGMERVDIITEGYGELMRAGRLAMGS
jgi:hypothetical protein